MKKQFTILTLIFATLFANSQNIIAPDTISVNTVWADTIFIDTNLYVLNGIYLKINPGSKIIFRGAYNIDCQGQIIAKGNAVDSIKFTINDTLGLSDMNPNVTAGGWGGIRLINTPNTNDSSFFSYCIFEYGKANGTDVISRNGACLHIENFSKIKISNSLIKNCISLYNGGGFYFLNSSPIIIDNIFDNNHASEGGAISLIDSKYAYIKGNLFKYCYAGEKFYYDYGQNYYFYTGAGAAIHISSDIQTDKIKVIENRFYNNSASNGIFYESSRHTYFVNNIMCNNVGETIMNGHSLSESVYFNNTLVNNSALDYFITVDLYSQFVKFYNNIVIGYTNDDHFSQPLLTVNNNTTSNLMDDIKYNVFQYGQDYLAGEGNIVGVDAVFVSPSQGASIEYYGGSADWRLQSTSPCINAGIIDTSSLDLPEQDAFGNPRIYGNRIDIGAYENQTEIWTNVFSLESSAKMTFYPNPVQNNLTILIKSKELQNKKLQIFDINGKLVKQFNKPLSFGEAGVRLNVSDLETGVYYLRVEGLSKEFIKL